MVARLLEERPDLESFPRFRELNMRNLLYYQAELDDLKGRLKEQELKDWNDQRGLGGNNYSQCAIDLIESHLEEAEKDRDQWELVLRIRKLLMEYNAALLQHAQLAALPEPSTQNVECFRDSLCRTDLGNYFVAGSGSTSWGAMWEDKQRSQPIRQRLWLLLRSVVWAPSRPPTRPDLLTTRPQRNVDGFTRWIREEWVPFYRGCLNYKKPQDGGGKADVEDPLEKAMKQEAKPPSHGQDSAIWSVMEASSEKAILKFTSAAATVIACVLPTVAIGILTTATTTIHKLLYIGGFTALFAIGLMYLTDETSRVQIFTATAAFSAELVVFVQNQ